MTTPLRRRSPTVPRNDGGHDAFDAQGLDRPVRPAVHKDQVGPGAKLDTPHRPYRKAPQPWYDARPPRASRSTDPPVNKAYRCSPPPSYRRREVRPRRRGCGRSWGQHRPSSGRRARGRTPAASPPSGPGGPYGAPTPAARRSRARSDPPSRPALSRAARTRTSDVRVTACTATGRPPAWIRPSRAANSSRVGRATSSGTTLTGPRSTPGRPGRPPPLRQFGPTHRHHPPAAGAPRTDMRRRAGRGRPSTGTASRRLPR